MAEGFLKSFNSDLEVYSAGTIPAGEVHPKAIQVMDEIGIDVSNQSPKFVDQYLNVDFDFVFTVCDNARESCPVFTGHVQTNIHEGFEDPDRATGTEDEILNEFRKIRDQIKERFYLFYKENILLK